MAISGLFELHTTRYRMSRGLEAQGIELRFRLTGSNHPTASLFRMQGFSVLVDKLDELDVQNVYSTMNITELEIAAALDGVSSGHATRRDTRRCATSATMRDSAR